MTIQNILYLFASFIAFLKVYFGSTGVEILSEQSIIKLVWIQKVQL